MHQGSIKVLNLNTAYIACMLPSPMVEEDPSALGEDDQSLVMLQNMIFICCSTSSSPSVVKAVIKLGW